MSCGCHNTTPRDPGDDRCEEGHRFVRCDHGYCACNGGPSVVLGRGSRYWEATEPRDNPYTLRGEHGLDGWNWLHCYCGRRWPCKKAKYDEEKKDMAKANVYDDAQQTIVFKYGDRLYTVKGYVNRAEVSGYEARLEICGNVTSQLLHRTPHFQPDLVASRHTHGERCICRCSACLKDGKCICGECTCR